ncbi:hypothetical protein B0H10DRAFT_1958381 [Mycena sp. CBHHK59/15]|nr:hypothetical protein B0H10DRAFT_1958381 [Mycena sp. CBHHK59/15]
MRCTSTGILFVCISIVLADNAQTVLHVNESTILVDPLDVGMNTGSLPEVLNATESFSPCCVILDAALPGKIHFPESSPYAAQQASYYSAEQTELKPSCRVTPSSSNDVSRIVQIATENQCQFAVKSGGHMNWGGSSNVGPVGFTVDLQNLNEVSVLNDKGIVSFGLRTLALADSSWADYLVWDSDQSCAALAVGNALAAVRNLPQKLALEIFCLPGKWSEHTEDVCCNYVVVLADGAISDVNETSLPELYWALKYGSTNFGIVTRFDMTTYHLGVMWGGSLYFNISRALPLLESLVDLVPKLAEDPRGVSAVSLAWSPAMQDYAIWAPVIYRDPVEFPPLFSSLREVEPLMSTVRLTNLVDITDEYQGAAPSGVRAQWFSLTLKPDAQTMLDIFTKGAEIFDPCRQRAGLTWAATFQPINAGLVAVGSRHSGNPTGLSAEDGDLILYLGLVFWNDAEDDGVLKSKVQEHLTWACQTASQRGLLNRFIYLNYALGTQDVMDSVGNENLERMKRIKMRYDPQNLFGKYWVGGFKL